jgi:hypothetical protein
VVVQRELSSLPECLLVCNLVVMEWTAIITGDQVGLFRDFSLGRKIWRTLFDEAEPENRCVLFTLHVFQK